MLGGYFPLAFARTCAFGLAPEYVRALCWQAVVAERETAIKAAAATEATLRRQLDEQRVASEAMVAATAERAHETAAGDAPDGMVT